jgi:hypothetical protein
MSGGSSSSNNSGGGSSGGAHSTLSRHSSTNGGTGASALASVSSSHPGALRSPSRSPVPILQIMSNTSPNTIAQHDSDLIDRADPSVGGSRHILVSLSIQVSPPTSHCPTAATSASRHTVDIAGEEAGISLTVSVLPPSRSASPWPSPRSPPLPTLASTASDHVDIDCVNVPPPTSVSPVPERESFDEVEIEWHTLAACVSHVCEGCGFRLHEEEIMAGASDILVLMVSSSSLCLDVALSVDDHRTHFSMASSVIYCCRHAARLERRPSRAFSRMSSVCPTNHRSTAAISTHFVGTCSRWLE